MKPTEPEYGVYFDGLLGAPSVDDLARLERAVEESLAEMKRGATVVSSKFDESRKSIIVTVAWPPEEVCRLLESGAACIENGELVFVEPTMEARQAIVPTAEAYRSAFGCDPPAPAAPMVVAAVPYATTKSGAVVYRTGKEPVGRTLESYEPTEETDEP